MACQILISHHTHDKEQVVSSMLETINLANLDDKSMRSQHLIDVILTVVILTSVWLI